MKASEIIKTLEGMPGFADNPEVTVAYLTASGENRTVEIEHIGLLDKGVIIRAKHQCDADFYWNGKLLKDVPREELEDAVVMLSRGNMTVSEAEPAKTK